MKPEIALHIRRRVEPLDVDRIAALVRETGRFGPAEVEVAVELLQENLVKGDASSYFVAIADVGGGVAGYTCYGRIPCTRSSFDLYWIAVDPRMQGRGIGLMLMRDFESQVRDLGGTNIYIDTSTRADYAPTRGFYTRCGYAQEATLRDFYAPGDGKAIFSKSLR